MMSMYRQAGDDDDDADFSKDAMPVRRPRRLRRTPVIRDMVREVHVELSNLVQPLFVNDRAGMPPEPIPSMPGQFRRNIQDTVTKCLELYELGIRAVAIFPCIESFKKDPTGKEALNEDTLVLRCIRSIKKANPKIIIFSDIALDPYTSHGHDGVLTEDGSDVDNDETVAILAKMAVLHAQAGADFVAPSDMMDGRVGAIREALDDEMLTNTAIMSYTAKYASAFYGPFRDAVGSSDAAGTTLLGKQTYQMDPANRREAKVVAELDEAEGADVLMVKPAGYYLDIIQSLEAETSLPIAAYQVSGEYAQIVAAAEKGWLDLKSSRDESILAIRRAGANIIFTYFAEDIARDRAQK